MPRYIVKPDPNREFYVDWSEIVDNLVAYYSSRAEAIADGIKEERLDRADKYGSSSPTNMGRWDDDFFIVREEESPVMFSGNLPRRNMEAFAIAVCAGDYDTAASLVEVDDDEIADFIEEKHDQQAKKKEEGE